ncbi:MAG TPA: ribonuclease R [Burkholderiaceae bacterium]|nr:ribonuclease R [Burkholderiaceae bacterium]
MTKAWVPPTREAILDCLRKADAPLTPRELAERLDVPTRHFDTLERRIVAMERDGQLLPNRKGVLLLASRLDLVPGKILGHRDGFGFLIPDEGGPDVFLSPREMQKAMHGDRVLVKRIGFDSRGKPEGVIVEVTERASRRLVGRLVNERGVTIVVPEDQRIKHDILIPPGDAQKAQPGQVVTVEILEPPSGHAPPIGRVVEVLGAIDDPGMEIEIAVRKFEVPHEFSPPALAEAAALPNQVQAADYRDRVDLRDVPLVTIDGADARDFDDAVYCEPLEGAGRRAAGWRLIVAIADVSHYVQPGSALDRDALERSTSVYFPRRVIPMLPEKLSNGLCSLNPDVDRLVLVADMVITARGKVKAYQFYNAVMHSAARLTYDEVWGILSGRDALAIRQRDALVPHLHQLYELYRVLAKAREVRGAIDFETVETQIICDAAGRIERIVARTRNDAHKLIEECMLAANTCAADFMQRSRHPGLYRVHEGPTPERLALLREFLGGLGLTLGGGDEPKPADYAKLAEQIRNRPDSALLQTMLLRSMQQAIYSPSTVGHFGLAYDAYAHFTSPIRRYPDLLTHRVIKSLLQGSRYRPTFEFGGTDEERIAPPASGSATRRRAATREAATRGRTQGVDPAELDVWERLGMLCSANERRADDASRDVEAWLKAQYMRERVGEQFRGRITGVAPFGIFVTLNELFVEGMVHVSELGSEYFQYIEAAHELRGERTGQRFRLTDELDVQVSRVDLEARRIEFRLVRSDAARSELRAVARAAGAEQSAPRVGRKAASGKTERIRRARAERQAARQRNGASEKRSGPRRRRR